MDVVIYQSLIIHIFVLFYGVHTASVGIDGSKVGLMGENGTEIKCSYTTENIIQFYSVSVNAYNRSSVSFQTIVTFPLNHVSLLTTEGQYLKGRVTLTNITESSTEAVMTINKLICIDDNSYQCQMNVLANGPTTLTSKNINISVQVTPSKPDSVSLVHTSADSSVTTAKLMDYSTSLPSTVVTLKENNTASASKMESQNTTTPFNHSTMQTSGHDIPTYTTSPDNDISNISYKTTTYSTQQPTMDKVLAEGDNITVVCTGEVGNPPAEHFFQKYRDGHTEQVNYTASATSIIEISENCSYYRTSNFTLQVTAHDNNAVIRCVVNSPMAEPDMYVKTEPIKVFYKASMPNITIYPKKEYYVVGENTSILLTCKSDGNPKPYYQWYKENNELISENESWIITDMNVTNSGVYTCNVSNTFNGMMHRNAKHVQINIRNKADVPTTQPSSTSSSSGIDKKEEKSIDNLVPFIGSVVAVIVVVIVVLIVIIACRRRKSKSPTFKNASKGFDDSKPKPVTEPRTGDYDYIVLEDDPPKSSNNDLEAEDIKKHNEEYLKKQEEEEKKKNESNTPPQPAVYAQVNEATKSKNKPKTDSTENTDKQEEDPYAETQEDVYDKAGNSRHKENENVEHLYSLSSSKQNSNGDNKQSIQTSQVGSFTNQGFEKDENRKVATVSPTVRSSTGSQNDEHTNSNRNSQSKKGYENIIGTDQTGISLEESSHRTAL